MHDDDGQCRGGARLHFPPSMMFSIVHHWHSPAAIVAIDEAWGINTDLSKGWGKYEQYQRMSSAAAVILKQVYKGGNVCKIGYL